MIDQLNFSKLHGLVPAIIQDASDGTVLMLGFMNDEAFRRTVEEQEVVFWSRSKNRLWKKGETSGNALRVVSISPDCDNDALLIRALPAGPVCHTGTKSCFTDPSPAWEQHLTGLFRLIQKRRKDMPPDSYTAKLFSEGIPRISQKVGEEAVELAIAAQHNDHHRVIEESADLLYHVLVLLAAKEVDLMEIYDELGKRGRIKQK